jgi:isoleucyl-tRNA synthetase
MLHILSTALFDRPAFSSVICHGIVLGSDGQKMSKSLRNYPDVREVFDRDGADAMRWFLMSSPILRGGNLIVTEQGIRDGVRQVLIPLWNTWYFFSLYANAFGGGDAADGGQGYDARWSTGSTDPLDRYLLAKLGEFVRTMQEQLDAYEVANACETTRGFLDVLTNWYVRRSRERFWDTGDGSGASGDGAQGGGAKQAFDTLYTALEVVCRVAAPLLPLTTEEIWRGLTGGRSVHLTDWPDFTDLPTDPALVAGMDRAREVCSVASSLRKAGGLRVRLPLNDLTVVTSGAASLKDFGDIIADEVNVRTVTLRDISEASQADFGITQRLTVNARAAGPRLGRDVQLAIKGSKSGDWSVAKDGTVTAGGLDLVDGEYTLETVVDAGDRDGARATAMLPGGGFVVLDTTVTPELAQEGLARDIVRAVQQAIKGSKSGDWSVADDGTVTAGGLELVEGEYTLETVVDEPADGGSTATAMLPGGGFVVLDTAVTPELAQEGLARDVIRAVQQARRDAGLEVSDRISLTVTGGETVWRAVVAHQELIMAETLAQQFGSAGQLDALPQRTDVTDATVADGEPVRIKVMKLAG